MDKAKSISTPMSTSCSLEKNEKGKPFKESKYLGMFKSLLYLNASCHNIMFFLSLGVHFPQRITFHCGKIHYDIFH